MASRSRRNDRSSRDSDSMEALKPLVVLVLFGTILYGAYSVVQKGPTAAPDATSAATTSDAPPFAPPAVEVPPAQPAAATPVAPTTPVVSAPLPAAPPVVPQPLAIPAMPATSPAATAQTEPPVTTGPLAPPPTALPGNDSLSTAAVAGVAAGAGAALGAAAGQAGVSPSAPTYLTAEAAPPPAQEALTATSSDAAGRPDRYAALAPPLAQSALPAADSLAPTGPAASGSSTAFATAWADAHDKLASGRYAEALAALSVWYDDPSLGLEESQRLEDLLGQLAGTVVYSQEDLLLAPHVVAAGETLPAIAAPLGVSWQLLGKINGIDDPQRLVPGEHLKVFRGPFDAVVSVSRRRLSLQIGGNYAGSFPVVIGRQLLGRVGGAVAVVDVRRGADRDVQAVSATAPQASGRPAIILADGLAIEAAEDPGVVSDSSPETSLVVSVRDLAELIDILGPGSRVLVRQ